MGAKLSHRVALAAALLFTAPAWSGVTGTGGEDPVSPGLRLLEWAVPDPVADAASEAATPVAGGDKSVACGLYMSGAWTYQLDPNIPRAYVTLGAINNDSFGCENPTGTLRLEYWAVTTANLPLTRGGGFFGQRLAIFPPNGQLFAGFSFLNINGNAPYTVPAYGTYWIVMSLSEYSPAFCTNADFYCVTDTYISNTQVTIGNSPLTVSRNGTGSGTVTSPSGINCGTTCSASIFGGTLVTLTATPAAGSTFSGWSGSCAGTGLCQVSMNVARSVTATFTLAALDPAADNDGDGVPNGVETNEALNPLVKDNDIFAVTSKGARLFGMQQYRDFLGREGDAGGVTYYQNNIFSGALSRQQAIENFYNSAEFSGIVAPVTRLYFAFFNRIPDYAGLTFQVNAYRTGTPLTVIANNFAASPEFVATYGALNNTQYVTLLYTNVLGRAASPAEITYHVNRLNTGVTRGEVMTGFSESPEYKTLKANAVYVTNMYVGMLRRSPEQAGFDYWVAYMAGGNSGLALIQGFLLSLEYHNRFLP